jgi:hypothetical protein
VRLELRRSGGFAGIARSASVDTADLPAEEADELAGLLERSGVLRAGRDAGRPARSPGAPDRFRYRLVVERREERVEVGFGEEAMGPELRALVERLLAAG